MKLNFFVKEIAASDSAMKLVFDHVRNLGICAAVFAAAAWQMRHIGTPWPTQLIGGTTVGVLSLLGFWLFAVNQQHGFLKLLESGVTHQHALLIGQAYTLASVTLIASIIIR